jgi:5-methylthioadenosine/S-adenosylhomocysteine deaminase
VFAANGSCVDTTIINGKIVMENRQFTTIDEQKVLREANEAFRRVLDRMVVPAAATT